MADSALRTLEVVLWPLHAEKQGEKEEGEEGERKKGRRRKGEKRREEGMCTRVCKLLSSKADSQAEKGPLGGCQEVT